MCNILAAVPPLLFILWGPWQENMLYISFISEAERCGGCFIFQWQHGGICLSAFSNWTSSSAVCLYEIIICKILFCLRHYFIGSAYCTALTAVMFSLSSSQRSPLHQSVWVVLGHLYYLILSLVCSYLISCSCRNSKQTYSLTYALIYWINIQTVFKLLFK